MKRVVALLLVIVAVLASAPRAHAQEPTIVPPMDDVIIGPPTTRGIPLTLVEERISVTIEGQVAQTRLTQRFRNDTRSSIEGEYLFPLPPDAAISDLDMTVNGERLEGQILRADEARAIYEEIVRQQIDPALLEWVGNGLFRTHIFPIGPGETRDIDLEYSQVLTAESGLLSYRFPLRQGSNATLPVETASVSVELKADAPIRAIYSPSHEVALFRNGEQGATVGWEGSNVTLDSDFTLFWSVSPEDIDLQLLSFQPSGEDGYFMLLAAPSVTPPEGGIVARDVVLVVDISGSMDGEKMEQAKAALKYVLGHLNPDDRFNVLAFSTGTRPFASKLQPASEAQAAINWVDQLTAEGSTDIGRALLEGMAFDEADDRPMLLLFMTDGLPTVGMTSGEEIMRATVANAPENMRLFSFGVGYDVDTVLLDGVATTLGGRSTYVQPEENIEEQVSAFYSGVSAPVLSDVKVDWGGAAVEELYPSPLPDLFAGQQMVVVGRYRDAGPLSLSLSGTVNGQPQRFTYDDLTLRGPNEGEATWLPRLWATRKIGALLQSLRINGPNEEVVQEIIALGLRFGIVTPYTTFLVEEAEVPLPDADGSLPAPSEAAAATAETTGAGAVRSSQDAGDMAEAERSAPMAPALAATAEGQTAAMPPRVAGSRTFVLRDGIWTDTQYRQDQARTAIAFGSDEWFALAAQSSDVAQALSVGAPLIVVVNGVAYEVTAEGDAAQPRNAPTATPGGAPDATTVAITPPSGQATATAGTASDTVAQPAQSNSAMPLLVGGGIAVLAAGAALMLRKR